MKFGNQKNDAPPRLESRGFQRSRHKEKKDLFYAGILISLAFAVLFSGGFNVFSMNFSFILLFALSFFTAGIGFLLHELMHKYAAQKYGLRAEFRAFYPGLWMALAFSFLGFIIAAPGAVVISGFINKEKNGKISLAGPLTNVALALLFFIPAFLIKLNFISLGAIGSAFFAYGLEINSLLALFNMIPAMPFDGAKILAWNKSIYFSTIIAALLLFIASYIF